jgi:alkylation response protein AidB-like acyl-CoA dehydrogenase
MFEFFTEEQKLLRRVVRSFVNEHVAPHADEWDRTSRCPVELFPVMGELGMIGCFVPEHDGGAGMGIVERTIIVEEIARHSAGLAIAFMTNDITIAILQAYGSSWIKEKYIGRLLRGDIIGSFAVTEWSGGSDFVNQGTTIKRTEQHIVVKGQKCFVTNSTFANFAIITGVSKIDKRGRNVITGVLIPEDTEGFQWGRVEHKIGMKCSITGDLMLSDCVLPHAYQLGEDGSGKAIALNTIGRYGRSAMTAIAVGILRGCLEESVKFAKQRKIYGNPLHALFSAQSILAQNRSEYEAAHAILYNAVSLREDDPQYLPRIASAKLFCAEAAVRSAKRSIDLMGSYGLLEDYPMERYLRDALTVIPSGGTAHIMSIITANDLVR